MTQHINGKPIRTHWLFPPIPVRIYDWTAVLDSYEPDDPIGYGVTEQDAINDLRQQIEDEEEENFETSSAVGS
jgi:hypothetical protein